jgi:putative copper export protein
VALVWTLVLFVHVAAAAFWVGGQLMLAFVVLPLLRRSAGPELVREMARQSGRRFAGVTNFALLPVLAVTGALMAWHDGVRWHSLNATAFGHVLEAKVALVAVVFALAGAHGAVARRLSRRKARSLAQVTMVLSVAILGLAAALAVLPGP